MSLGSMHAFDARNGAGRDCSGFLLFTGDAHHDEVAGPGRFRAHPDVSRPAILEANLEHDLRVHETMPERAALASHAPCCARGGSEATGEGGGGSKVQA